MALAGIVLVVAAIGFRVTLVPFHLYAPDVYEGGPAGVVAQLAVLPKVAGFIALARLLGLVGTDGMHLPFDTASQLPLLLWILAILTMTLGNVLASASGQRPADAGLFERGPRRVHAHGRHRRVFAS